MRVRLVESAWPFVAKVQMRKTKLYGDRHLSHSLSSIPNAPLEFVVNEEKNTQKMGKWYVNIIRNRLSTKNDGEMTNVRGKIEGGSKE